MSSTRPILIEAARCFDGVRLLPDPVDVLLSNGRIEWLGSGSAPQDVLRIPAGSRLLMPGLIDVHVHLEGFAAPDRIGYIVRTPPTLMAFYAARNARLTLEAGFTTLRNMAFTALGEIGTQASVALRQAIERGLIEGPRIVTGGVVDRTGGHFDLLRPPMFPRDPEETADGEAAVRQMVRRHVRAGADFIKFATTGGIVSEGDEPDWVMYSEVEVAALVDESHSMKRRTSCHAYGTDGIKRALRAGTDTLEHGTYMDDEGLDLLLKNKTVLVPTLSFFHGVVTRARELNLPAYWLEKCGPAYEAEKETVRKARIAGARVAYGTDAAGGRHNPHGENARELALWVGLGFSPEQVLVAATSAAADAIGLAGVTGRIAPGYSADLLLVDGDPLQDLSVLSDKQRIKQVICRGRIAVERP